MDRADVESGFWPVFARVLGRPVQPGRYAQAELPEWDSLRHVELMFELEERFRIEVPADAIAGLFSDTETLIEFVAQRAR